MSIRSSVEKRYRELSASAYKLGVPHPTLNATWTDTELAAKGTELKALVEKAENKAEEAVPF